MLPFSVEQFFGVFRAYNVAVWPAQLVLVGLALIALWLAVRPGRWSDPIIAGILGLLWLWLGLVYHLSYFAAINPLAYVFAAFSAAGGLAFLWYGVARRSLHFHTSRDWRGRLGVSLVLFSLLVYPLLSVLAGHIYPASPTFGLPCPTTFFTIGMLAFLVPPYPRLPLVVPVLWCLVGAQAALLLGVHQDAALLVAAVAGGFLMVRNKKTARLRGPLFRD